MALSDYDVLDREGIGGVEGDYPDPRRDVDNMMAQAADEDLALPLECALAAVARIDEEDGRIPGLAVLFVDTLREVLISRGYDPDSRL